MEAKSIVTQPARAIPPNPRGIKTLPALDLAFLILISLVMLSAIALPIYNVISKRKQHSFSLKLRQKFPCRRCQYFSGNPYLRCALHPATVLSEQAVDCIDYLPEQ